MYISAAFAQCILLGKMIFQKVFQSVLSSLFLLAKYYMAVRVCLENFPPFPHTII